MLSSNLADCEIGNPKIAIDLAAVGISIVAVNMR